MEAHRFHVVIPSDHKLVVEIPKEVRSGPAELIVLVPWAEESSASPSTEAKGRLASLAAELAKDPTSFQDLSEGERKARLKRVMGAGRGLLSSSEEFAHRKIEEIELEEAKLRR
jgi:hypothetical protein